MANVEASIADYLEADERIIWTGVPARGLLFRREDRFQLPFGVLWFVLTLFFSVSILLGSAASTPAPAFLIPIVFVIFGFYLAAGRFIWDADVRGRTTYALTDRRAVILRRFPRTRFTSMRLSAATEVQTIERRDGSGTIYFGPRSISYNGFPRPSPDMFMFERIRDFKVAIAIVRTGARGKG